MNETKKQTALSEQICELQTRIDVLSEMLDGAKKHAPELVVPLRERLNMSSYEQDCLYRTLHALDGIEDKHVYPTDKEAEVHTDDLTRITITCKACAFKFFANKGKDYCCPNCGKYSIK